MTSPESVLREGADTYETKNEDYGDSWRAVGEILHKLADGEVVLEEPEDHIQYGLFTRRLDKMARAIHAAFSDAETNHESVVDSHKDEAIYAAMHAALLSDDSNRQGNRQVSYSNRARISARRTLSEQAANLSSTSRKVQRREGERSCDDGESTQ